MPPATTRRESSLACTRSTGRREQAGGAHGWSQWGGWGVLGGARALRHLLQALSEGKGASCVGGERRKLRRGQGGSVQAASTQLAAFSASTICKHPPHAPSKHADAPPRPPPGPACLHSPVASVPSNETRGETPLSTPRTPGAAASQLLACLSHSSKLPSFGYQPCRHPRSGTTPCPPSRAST